MGLCDRIDYYGKGVAVIMEFRQIEYFQVVSLLKNYTKAAEQLHMSQPSISVSIQKLEEELGVKLLERDNKKVVLTREGAIFLREGELVLKQAEHLKHVMDDLRHDGKRALKLAFPSTAGAWLWPVLLRDFASEYPSIELCIQDESTYEILEEIKKDELEIGFGVWDESMDDEIETHPLMEDELKLLVPAGSRLAAGGNVDIRSLDGMKVIMYRKGASFSEGVFLRMLTRYQVTIRLQYVREQSTVFNMVAQNLGVAVVLDDRTDLIRNNSSLRTVKFREPITYVTGFFWKKDRHLSSSARKLICFFDDRYKA